jgi:hypothetical protein
MISIIDIIGREKALSLMHEAILKAVKEDERLGLPKIVEIDGDFYKQYPNGRLERFGAKATTFKTQNVETRLDGED